ncbi:MAG: TPM domain-containing protein [Cytophagales bacterium]|nr:TPM domain-containing protein [Cytophagales bacterium]
MIPAAAQRSIPPHGGVWVHDEAGVISAGAKAQMEAILKAERDSTSNQIAVYIIPSMDGDDIDDYAVRVFKEMEVGSREKR